MSQSSGNPPIRHSDAIQKILRRTIQSVRTEPDPLVAARTLTRSTTIVGMMLEDLGDKRGGWEKVGGAVTRAGQILWSLVELAAPRSLGEVLFQHWIAIAYALAILMLITGILTGAGAVTRAGALVLGIAFTVHVLVEQLRRWMVTGDLRKLRPILLVPVLIVSSVASFSLVYRMGQIDAQIKANGNAETPASMSKNAGLLMAPDDVPRILGTAHLEENKRLMAAGLGWDCLFIVAYFLWFLSLGGILASHFVRPYRAFALVAIPAVVTVVCDAAENLQAYWALIGVNKLAPWYTSELKIEAGIVCLFILLFEGVVLLWRRSRTL